MDRLDTIELFVAVVETGSFSEAGRRFGYAPSAVTRRMDDLERWMGATLFYRSTRKITLTEVGDAFHRRASSILLEIEEARVTAAGLEDMPTGTVRMSVAASLGPQITAALNDFQERAGASAGQDESTLQARQESGSGVRSPARIAELSQLDAFRDSLSNPRLATVEVG